MAPVGKYCLSGQYWSLLPSELGKTIDVKSPLPNFIASSTTMKGGSFSVSIKLISICLTAKMCGVSWNILFPCSCDTEPKTMTYILSFWRALWPCRTTLKKITHIWNCCFHLITYASGDDIVHPCKVIPFKFILNYISPLTFHPQKSPTYQIYPSPLSFKFMVSLFVNCYCVHFLCFLVKDNNFELQEDVQ